MPSSTQWPLAVSTYSFAERNLDIVLEKLKKMGFSLVDIGWPQVDIQNNNMQSIKVLLNEKEVHPFVFSLDLPANETSKWYYNNSSLLGKAIQTASYLTCRKVGLVVRAREGSPSRESLPALIQLLKKAAADCERFKIPVCIEIHPNGPLSTLSDAKLIQKKINSSWIGCTLDTSLLTWLSIDLEDALYTLKEGPLNIHLRDVTENDFFGIPGRGCIDFKKFFYTLKKINYTDPCVIELFRTKENFGLELEEAISETKSYLGKIINGLTDV